MWRTNTLEKPSCWERLRKVEGEGDNKRWDGWMASLTWWTWVKASFRCWLWTGKPGVLQSKGSQFNSVQFSHSVVSDSLRPHESQHARPPCPSPTPRVHSDTHPSTQWCHPAISSSVVPVSSCPQFRPASDFSNESTLRMRWPKFWSFTFSISPSKEIPRLISFRMDWLDPLAVQGTLKSLLQHHSSKASVL